MRDGAEDDTDDFKQANVELFYVRLRHPHLDINHIPFSKSIIFSIFELQSN